MNARYISSGNVMYVIEINYYCTENKNITQPSANYTSAKPESQYFQTIILKIKKQGILFHIFHSI